MIRIQINAYMNDLINIVKDQWVWFIDDQIEVMEGNRNHFCGKMQKSSMIDNEEAEKRLTEWQNLQKLKIRN
jgi:hypothetical protein